VEGDDYAQLYQTVLIDLPIGGYFRKFLEGLLVQDSNKDGSRIPEIMKDFKPEKIKNLLKKIWITDFFHYCQSELSSPSKEIMADILKFESDCMTIQIIYNSIGSKDLGGSKGREGERKKYINNLGKHCN
jgi:V-type H+-transporting ATPase subunit d